MTTASTPWGSAAVVDQLTVAQRAAGKRFASVVQLLELPSGERLLRVAYTTDGRGRRGPVTLRERDVERLRAELDRHDELRRALMGA